MHSSIYIFSTIWPKEAKRGKNGPKLQKTLSVVPFISETIYISYGHMVFIYGTHVCIKEQYLQAFFSFLQNFDFRDH